MLRPVWPGSFVWSQLALVFSCASIPAISQLEILGKPSSLVDVVVQLALVLGFLFGNLVFFFVFVDQLQNPRVDRLFQGYGRVKKATGDTLLFFLGNILVYYYSEKSVACILAFFFVACSWFCGVCCLQPCTDFGVLDLLLSASLNVAFSHFGLRIYTWLLSIVCILVRLLRYFLWLPEEAVSSSSQVESPASDLPLRALRHSRSI